MLCAKFAWNLHGGSGEEKVYNDDDESNNSYDNKTTDKFWSEKLLFLHGSDELKGVLFLLLNSSSIVEKIFPEDPFTKKFLLKLHIWKVESKIGKTIINRIWQIESRFWEKLRIALSKFKC